MTPNENQGTAMNLLHPRAMPRPAMVPQMTQTVAEQLKVIEARQLATPGLYIPAAAGGAASNTVEGPASIAELARALKNDPDLIYQWVYNNIEFTPTFGEQKGALGCLIDGYGNAFDQAALLSALFTQAGLSPSYLFGNVEFSAAQAAAWLGTDPADIGTSYGVLYNGGIPVQYASNLGYTTVYFSHLWVQVVIGGTNYVFDPSYKSYTATAASVNLATATGYTRSGLFSQAEVGATVDPGGVFVKNMNRANLRSQLATYSTNLATYIKTNNPTATLSDVVGGRSINQISTPVRQTSLSYQDPSQTPTTWASIPNNYRVQINLQTASISTTFYGSDIHGKQLTLFFNASGFPVLTLNGTVIATGTYASNQLALQIYHPYVYINANQNLTENIQIPTASNQWYYMIGATFGPVGRGLSDYWQSQYAQRLAAGGSALSEPVLGSELAASFYSYIGQLSAAYDLNGRIGQCAFLTHHSVGVAVWQTSTAAPAGEGLASYDVGGLVSYVAPLVSTANYTAVASVGGQNGHTTEMAGLQQSYGVAAVGPSRIIDVANLNGLEIIKITPANQSTTLPLLSGYDANMMSLMNSALSAGYSLYVPQVAPETVGAASVQGFAEVSTGGGFGGWLEISKGGGVDDFCPPSKVKPKKKDCDDCPEADPVDTRTGDYQYENHDIKVGSSTFPYALEFKSMYDSRIFTQTGPLGRGWSHNWIGTATLDSDGLKAMGAESPIEAAASMVEMFVLQDIYSDTTYPVEKVVVGIMCAQWWCDSLSNNTVNVSLPDGDHVFTLLQDGSYHPPLNDASTLVKNGDGTYTHTTPQQEKRNFDSSGNLSTWVFPYGVTITLGYTSGNLTTISNGLGRQLTLAYTSGFLSSVTDGNSRTVKYTVNATSKQMTKFTDALNQATTFTYDSTGRFLSYFKPQNPSNAVVINSYDTLNRISSQKDIYSNVRTFYLAGSRSEYLDPAGHSKVTYFDAQGHALQDIDELGNVTAYVRDGLGRLTKATRPEGNSEQWTYDNKNNALTHTKVPKAGSGLANIVETFTYDATYNKKHTFQDGRLNTWTYNYDPSTGNLLSVVGPTVAGQIPQVVYTYNARGQVLTVTDETGIVTKNSYDSTTEKLLTQVVDFGVSPHFNLTTTYGYDTVGNTTTIKNPNLFTTTFVFDKNRRLMKRTETTPFSYVTNYLYDLNNNLTSVQRQTGNAMTPYQIYTIAYTLSDKVKTVTDPATNVTTKTYDTLDRLWTVTDAELRKTTFLYTARSDLFTITDATNTVSETRTYTNNGRLYQLTDARSKTTTYSYDGFDRAAKTLYSDASYEQNTSYDANGNVLTSRTRSGSTVTNTYDPLNRLSTKAPSGQATVTTIYDLHGRIMSESTPVVSGNPATGMFSFAYDTAGRRKSETTPDSKVVQYGLDANGNVTKLTYPDGYYITNAYDQLDRFMNTKLNGASASAIGITYDQLSRRSVLTYGNGVTSTYTFQFNDDLTGLAEAFVGSSVVFTYGFNKVHQENSRSVSDGTYLRHPSAGGTVTYAAANSVNEYPTVGGITYQYDGNGNLKSDGTWTYTYDTENHLISASKTGVSASYVYDPFHRQIQKTVGTTKSRYVYTGSYRLADYDGTSGTLQTRYVYGPKVDEPLIQVSASGVLTYLHADRQGSIIATSNSTGNVSGSAAYEPYGQGTLPAGTTFGFTGQRFDAETGLYYYKHRYYSPALGRFLQPDPIGYTTKSISGVEPSNPSAEDCGCGCHGTCNDMVATILILYHYVANDPLNFKDPSGLAEEEVFLSTCLEAAAQVEYNCTSAFGCWGLCEPQRSECFFACADLQLAATAGCWTLYYAGKLLDNMAPIYG